jgi:hypothetical protein
MKVFESNNEFRFNCPSLSVEVRLVDCLSLRDRVWRGDRPDERKGCQACMIGGKCAAAQIVKDAHMRRDRVIDYHAAQAKVGALEPTLIASMRRVIIPPNLLDRHQVTDAERAAIEANTGFDDRVVKTPRVDTSNWNQASAKVKPRSTTLAVDDGVSVSAAISGDMSAAINRAVAQQPAETKSQPKPQSTKPVATSAPTQGLSLLERARLAKHKGQAA